MTPDPPPARPVVPIIDLGEVLHGIVDDPNVVGKVVIGSLLWISCMLVLPIPFSGPVIMGYMIMTTRNSIAGEAHPLPEWSAYGTLWGTGIRYILAMMAGGAALANDGGQVVAMVGLVLFYVVVIGVSLLSVVLRFTLFPTIQIQLAETGDLSACFAFRELWEIFRANPWNIALAGLIEYVGQFAVSVAMCFCIVPAFPVSFLVYALTASAIGQGQRRKLIAYGAIAEVVTPRSI